MAGLVLLLLPLELVLVRDGPLGAQGQQPQSCHQTLAFAQVGEGADEGDEGVRALVQQVVVPVGSQGQVFRAREAQFHGPGPLPVGQAQRVVVRVDFCHLGLGVVHAQLLPGVGVLLAAGQQGHAGSISGDLQGEGIGDGNGAEEVFHAQQGALAGAGRRHPQ
jgi:hypothetical protein